MKAFLSLIIALAIWQPVGSSAQQGAALARVHVITGTGTLPRNPKNRLEYLRYATTGEARLTGKLKSGDNQLKVVIDGSENPAIPPFGGRIDYLTYAGIYRDVWLKVTAPVSIGSVKIETPDALAAKKSVTVRVELVPTLRAEGGRKFRGYVALESGPNGCP